MRGTGQMVFDLFNAGFKNAVGIDPYLESDITHPNGCKVLKKSIYEKFNQWDVVMLNHVFEHMNDPLQALKKLKSFKA